MDKYRELIAKWRQNSKGYSNNNFVKGMDHQAGICADELEQALAEPVPARASYLEDLKHDVHDEEYAWRYLSACAMESGEALRIGIRDVIAAAKELRK